MGKTVLNEKLLTYRLIRTWDGSGDARIGVKVPDTTIRGEITYRRFRSYDPWTTVPLIRSKDSLTGSLPHQAIAGKVMYQVTLQQGDQKVLLNNEPAVLRYKGYVPMWVLLPHIIIIFLAMLFSTITGLEAIFKGKNTLVYTWITLVTLFLGGLILGPIVQKFSFNAYWTGWPFGHDLTDNKSLFAFIFWVIALVMQYRNRMKRFWTVLASFVLLVVFLIPHSVLGSEIDYTKVPKTGNYSK
jgi:hypothetical protein